MENDIVNKAIKHLSAYFFVDTEVWSRRGKSRIDMVLVHLSDISNKYPIGVEFKINEKKQGKDLGKWLKQAIRYTEADFVKYGKMLIITYPQISGLYMEEGIRMAKHPFENSGIYGYHHNVNTFLAQFNVGELQYYIRDDKYYYRIVFNAVQVWDEYYNSFQTERILLWQNI